MKTQHIKMCGTKLLQCVREIYSIKNMDWIYSNFSDYVCQCKTITQYDLYVYPCYFFTIICDSTYDTSVHVGAADQKDTHKAVQFSVPCWYYQIRSESTAVLQVLALLFPCACCQKGDRLHLLKINQSLSSFFD